MSLEANVKTESNKAFLSLKGVLDISTIEGFKGYMNKLQNAKKINIDFSEVEFIDSTGVGSLVQVIKNLHEKSAEIKITNISSDVFEVLEILGLIEIFEGVFEQIQN